MSISFWTQVISTTGTLFASFCIFDKSINYNIPTSKKAITVFWCFLWAVFYSFEPFWMPLLMIRAIGCAIAIAIIRILTKIKLDTAVAAYLLSYGISNIFYFIAFALITVIFAPFLGTEVFYDSLIDFNEPIYLLFYALIAVLQFLIAYRFFKIRRFKLGFPFLSGRYAVVIALIIAGIIVAVFSLVTATRENSDAYHRGFPLIAGLVIIGAGIYIWIRRSIKMFQRKKAWERNEELFLEEKEKLTRELEHYKEMHEAVRAANHKMMQRQAAAERSILMLREAARENGLPAEFSEELAAQLDIVRKLAREYQESVGIEVKKKLPSTNVRAIDDMFGLFSERFAANGIEFNLKVNGSIVYMVENVIAQSKLETMIGDHLQDALIAVNASSGTIRNVLAMIGEAGNCYEFSVHDSGVPFEVDTLVRLGTERVTTHADGSGVGFMTTFETMRECGASLIIHENAPGTSFSKIVTIRFDSENRYIIETYRPGDFPESDRYMVAGT